MYSAPQLLSKYLLYYLTAFNSKGHGMHSPFVFDFILYVLNNNKAYYPGKELESVRKELLRRNELVTVKDLGAGSRVQSSKQRSIQQIAKSAVKPPKYSHLLYRLIQHYKPSNIIELGTSLGVTTAYLASANPAAKVVTIEGSEEIHRLANDLFKKLHLTNVQSLLGNFDVVLPDVLKDFEKIDVGYIDGNHRYSPTINYFQQLLQKAHNDTILIFDDIHWSKEMEKAWEEIKSHPSVRCTIDIFFLGFVFFRAGFKEKQHFNIRF